MLPAILLRSQFPRLNPHATHQCLPLSCRVPAKSGGAPPLNILKRNPNQHAYIHRGSSVRGTQERNNYSINDFIFVGVDPCLYSVVEIQQETSILKERRCIIKKKGSSAEAGLRDWGDWETERLELPRSKHHHTEKVPWRDGPGCHV